MTENRPVMHSEKRWPGRQTKDEYPGKTKMCKLSWMLLLYIEISPRDPLERDLLGLVPRIFF